MSADQQPNGYEITKWAERCKVGTPTLKLILLLLALKANAKGPHPGYCYCKHETLAEAAECSRRPSFGTSRSSRRPASSPFALSASRPATARTASSWSCTATA